MVGLAAGWIVPGMFVALADEKNRAPWFGALLMGLFLTGIGSRGWTFYYLPCLPLVAFAIATAIESVRGRLRPWAVSANWAVVLCSILALSALRVPDDFSNTDWPESTAVLKRAGATHLVVTERHSLWVYPWMKPLLYSDRHSTPAGLVLDTLIVTPRRIAVYRLTYKD